MKVSALILTTPKPLPNIQSLHPTTSFSSCNSKPTCSCSSSSPSTAENNAKVSCASKFVTKKSVLDVGFGLLAASLVALSPLEANATRIEYYATVGEPLCELNFVRSGLGFCDVSVGSGVDAPRGELINVHYTARFADGTVFDSSYKRGRPLTMRIGVGKVIRGLDQGIYGGDGVPPMQVGGKRKLHIPSHLAYGPEPAGCFSGDCNIPGNATLVYDINFVGIYSGNRPLPANR
ncbi:unnamed protein product [Prunus armeniaca]|uniref:peptidylprolyl isomerase n=1 Tax=Prunus armeniaca TaxID=36596 RepID=A0A6J5V388_PRUAR|nr:unnamed protein product [Prunus armeniaca]CAB4313846.1 unnamed protein product [Prunus armeniaca]